MTPEVFSSTKVYAINESTPLPVVVDHRFRYNTITVQPLNIVSPPAVLTKELLTEDNAVNTGTTGTITFTAAPPASYIEYAIPDSTVDLSAPAFLNLSIPIWKLYPTFNSLSGCTHLAITVTGFIS